MNLEEQYHATMLRIAQSDARRIAELEAERDNAWEELREIREAISANPEESTLDEVVKLRQQLDTFNSSVEHVTEDGCLRRSFVAMPEGWAMVHKDRLHDLELADEQLAATEPSSEVLTEVYVDPDANKTPRQLRAEGRAYCPKCYTFGGLHKKTCPYRDEGMSKHVKEPKP